jgi:dUTP pyrophosphatase
MPMGIVVQFEKVYESASPLRRTTENSARYDLFSDENVVISPQEVYNLRTGLKVLIPVGYVGILYLKSEFSVGNKCVMLGSSRVIDYGYRDEILVPILNLSYKIVHISPGELVAHLIFIKAELPALIETQKLEDPIRTDGPQDDT